ncbi:Hypothetical protein D9617_23g005940 [Elsinoe fawcettii]|nr:Hypothetical protein D9617_23g005940 [Elsinoe fawcettii]
MSAFSGNSYNPVREQDACSKENDDDERSEAHSFLHKHSRKGHQGLLKHPASIALVAAASCLIVFLLGFSLGRAGTQVSQPVPTSLLKQLLGIKKQQSSHQAQTPKTQVSEDIEGITAPESATVFDTLRSLPPIDLYREYGLRHNELSLYPHPLKTSVCLVDVDTREWRPHSFNDYNEISPLHWGYLNHYLYAKFHGYSYKHVQVPELAHLNTTWVKVKELYRMTMRDECKFVVMVDGDIIFQDLRVPMEALLSHWNMTEDIMIAGGTDLPHTHDYTHKQPHFNTGFLVTQSTPVFPKMMQDWIDCPTDVKYKTCSKWRWKWAREQAAFSSYIRYDPDYKPYIRQVALEEVHEGRFMKHYWGSLKQNLKMAAEQAILDRFMPDIYRGLLDDWGNVHEKTTANMYKELQEKYTPKSKTKHVGHGKPL